LKTGLVLEGGGMRGIYTAGVLDYFLDEGIEFDYVIGVSAGACNAVSYISRQKGRAYRINTKYITDKRYLSFENFIKTRSLFGMDFIFDEIPNKLEPFDMESYRANPTQLKIGVTDVLTGKAVYFDKMPGNGSSEDLCTILRASSSLPLFSPVVRFGDRDYLDGGTADPIPVKQAQEDGCDRLVVVCTRDTGYRKGPEKFRGLYKQLLKKYPNMITCLDRRHLVYNLSTEYAKELDAKDEAVLIAPVNPLAIDRFEKDPEKLIQVYQMGIADAKAALPRIKKHLGIAE